MPGEYEYRNKGVAYCPHCDGPLFKGKRVAVIGGGNSGVEAAIDLANIVGHVTLIEFDAQLRADQVLQDKLRTTARTSISACRRRPPRSPATASGWAGWSTRTASRAGAPGRARGRVRADRAGAQHRVAQGFGLALSRYGEIEIDHKAGTNLPGVFAAGDCTTVPYKQIVIAMGEGSKAALSAFDYIIRNAPAEDVAEAAPAPSTTRGAGGPLAIGCADEEDLAATLEHEIEPPLAAMPPVRAAHRGVLLRVQAGGGDQSRTLARMAPRLWPRSAASVGRDLPVIRQDEAGVHGLGLEQALVEPGVRPQSGRCGRRKSEA